MERRLRGNNQRKIKKAEHQQTHFLLPACRDFDRQNRKRRTVVFLSKILHKAKKNPN